MSRKQNRISAPESDPRQDAREGPEMLRSAHIPDEPPRIRSADPQDGDCHQDASRADLFDPLYYCPAVYADRYRRTSALARGGSPLQAVKLKCLDCCGWEYLEAKRCETSACALWLLNRRIFARTSTRKEAA